MAGDSSRRTFGLSSKPGLQVGMKGKQYGLLRPARPLSGSVFGPAALETETTAEQLRRDALSRQAREDTMRAHEQALKDDPSVFDYDGVYESMKASAGQAPRAAAAADRKPRYITSIVEAARRREVERDRVYERKLVRELEADAEQYGDTEKFVTAAYRDKLKEREQFEAAERLREAAEERQDVRKRGDLSAFHRNLLFAPSDADNLEDPLSHAGALGRAREASSGRGPVGPSKDHLPTQDHGQGQGPAPLPTPADVGQDGPRPAVTPPAVAMAPAAPAGREPPGPRAQGDAHRRNDDHAIQTARERYLQRKRARRGGDE